MIRWTRAHALGAFAAAFALDIRGAMAAPAPAPEKASAIDASEALSRLMSGNARYRRDASVNCNRHYGRRAEVAATQAPFAVVLGCADSRVPPEVVFDQRLGDLFVVRLAGNVADDMALGSMEYAIEHFGTPLVLVLGHERCGAVSATLDTLRSGASATGYVKSIVSAIAPAAQRALHEPGDPLHNAVRANVVAVAASIRTRLARHAHPKGGVGPEIRGATYDLGDGSVTLV